MEKLNKETSGGWGKLCSVAVVGKSRLQLLVPGRKSSQVIDADDKNTYALANCPAHDHIGHFV